MRKKDYKRYYINKNEHLIKNAFLQNRFLHCLICCITLVWLITAISPYDRKDWLLENLLVFVFMALLIITYPYLQFSNLSYLLIALMMSFHLVGAHYSYTETPLDSIIKEIFSFKRDNYDRIVHFMFGLLITFPLFEALIKVVRVRKVWAWIFSVALILAASCFYELLEMWVAKIVSPELGTLFLGTQGDPWDTQSDMAMAFYGSLIAMMLTNITYKLKITPSNRNKYIGFGG